MCITGNMHCVVRCTIILTEHSLDTIVHTSGTLGTRKRSAVNKRSEEGPSDVSPEKVPNKLIATLLSQRSKVGKLGLFPQCNIFEIP